jgi:mannose PTS system EIIA component
MVGMILFSHDMLAEAFRSVLVSVMGPQEQMLSLIMNPKEGSEEVEKKLTQAIPHLDDGDGVVIATDLFGGTPENFSIAQMLPGKVEVVSGMNLAMLLCAVEFRTRPGMNPVNLAREMVRAGRENIVLASEILKSGSVERNKSKREERCPS